MTYREKIEAIVREIAPHLRAGLDANTYATGMLEEAEDNQEHFEVRSFHTRTGNPYTFTISS